MCIIIDINHLQVSTVDMVLTLNSQGKSSVVQYGECYMIKYFLKWKKKKEIEVIKVLNWTVKDRLLRELLDTSYFL